MSRFNVAINQEDNSQPLIAAPVNFSASGDNVVIAGLARQIIRVERIFFVIAGAANVTFKDGVSNLLTGAMSLVSNGTVTLDFSTKPWFETAAGNGFIINLSTSVQVGGTVYYTQGS